MSKHKENRFMKMYSVKEISEMLDANPETVRRWIRAGKLKADQYSRKDGNMVQEDELYKYLRSTSKYAGIAAGMVASNSLLALTTIIGTGVTSILVSLLTRKSSKSEKDVRRLSADVERAIRANIAESEALIEKKKAAIAELQSEISKEQQQIEDCHTALEYLTGTLDIPEIKEPGEVKG